MVRREKKGNDPVPAGVQLHGKIKEDPEIVISKLTEEIIRQDLTTIRTIFEQLNENLSTLLGFDTYLQQIVKQVEKFGGA